MVALHAADGVVQNIFFCVRLGSISRNQFITAYEKTNSEPEKYIGNISSIIIMTLKFFSKGYQYI